MKMVLAGIAVSILLGFGAGIILGDVQRPAYQVFATSGTRVGNPGHNLVGETWNGLNVEGPEGGHKTEP